MSWLHSENSDSWLEVGAEVRSEREPATRCRGCLRAGLVPALAGRGLCSVGLGGLVGGSGRNGCGQGREGQELVGNNSGGLEAGGSGGG